MKLTLPVILLLIAGASCRLRLSNIHSRHPHDTYKVVRVDSINNVYLIYAKMKDTLYKIVSLKSSVDNGRAIVVNGYYQFDLVSLIVKNFQGYDISPQTILNLGGIDYSGTLIKLERPSILDIYKASNIKGLYVVE
jgi:hypothetical protein